MRIQFVIKNREISGINLPRITKVAQNENLSLGLLQVAWSLCVLLLWKTSENRLDILPAHLYIRI